MNSKCLKLTQQVVPSVYDVTPKPEYGKVLEVDMKNRMIGDGNLFAVKRRKFHQIVDRSEYLKRAIECVVTWLELSCSWRQGSPLRRLKGLKKTLKN
jgi:hypothetical protein